MAEITNGFEKLKKLIEPHKLADKQFFIELLDFNLQKKYEEERIKAVMLMLKALYINKLKAKIARSEERRVGKECRL